jgi:hypothetical protein
MWAGAPNRGMQHHWLAFAAPCLALSAWLGCGTSTTASDPVVTPPPDASCASPSIVEDGGGVIALPDAGAPLCPSGVCNYQSQTGCAADQACRPQFTATSTNVSPGCEAAGSGTSGAVCASGADCAAGYFCAEQTCHRQCCQGDWTVCDPGESCYRQLEAEAGGQVVESGLDLCFPVARCSPLDPSSCGDAGLECHVVDSAGSVACEPNASAEPGDDCSPTKPCSAKALCVLGSCRALCSADPCGALPCAEGQGTCVHYNRDPAAVGECTPE